MATIITPTIYQCNCGCTNTGNVLNAMTVKELNTNVEKIIKEYQNEDGHNRDYVGRCDLIHITDFGNFHICINCIRKLWKNLTNY